MIHARLPHEFQPRRHEATIYRSRLEPAVIGGISMLDSIQHTLVVTTTFSAVKPPDEIYLGEAYIHEGGDVTPDITLETTLIGMANELYSTYDWWSLVRKHVGEGSPVMEAIVTAPTEVVTLSCAEMPGVKYSFYNCSCSKFGLDVITKIMEAFTLCFAEIKNRGDSDAVLEYAFVVNPHNLHRQNTYYPAANRRLVVIGMADFTDMLTISLKSQNAQENSADQVSGVVNKPKVDICHEPFGEREWGLAHPYMVQVSEISA